MDSPRTSSHSVVSEFEGTLLKNRDAFSYFMLVTFEASGLIRSTILLFLCPVITLLDVFSYENAALKLMIFVATAGLREPEVELVARAVLPKFYMDDVNLDPWRVFSSCKKKVVVTRMPQLMVEWFAKEHLGADEVIGTELIVNGFGYVTGFIREKDIKQFVSNRVGNLFVDQRPLLGLGRPSTTFLSLCEEKIFAPFHWNHCDQQLEVQPPKPVIFYDGRFVKRPTPATTLLIFLWFPFGIVLASIRIFLAFTIPLWVFSYFSGILRIKVIVKGKPPQPPAPRYSGLLYVSNHKSTIDGYILSCAARRKIPSIAYFISWLPQILFPFPIVPISRTREIDARKIKDALSKGDLLMFPEGTTCREPFLLRFSALFAELTDDIVPVALNVRAGLFYSSVRGWDGLDLLFCCMNPTLVYEITFLDQLPVHDTCSSGKTSYDVANHVQRILADTLGFECTNFTKKYKYKLLT